MQAIAKHVAAIVAVGLGLTLALPTFAQDHSAMGHGTTTVKKPVVKKVAPKSKAKKKAPVKRKKRTVKAVAPKRVTTKRKATTKKAPVQKKAVDHSKMGHTAPKVKEKAVTSKPQNEDHAAMGHGQKEQEKPEEPNHAAMGHDTPAAPQKQEPTHTDHEKEQPAKAGGGETDHAKMGHGAARIEAPKGPSALKPVPENLPRWMDSPRYSEVFYKRGAYNFDIYNIEAMARDMNGVAVGHSMAYEDLVTGREAKLETDTFNRINWVLKNPPKNMPGERFISPTFARYYGYLEKVFDWTHILHAQTIDVLASTDLTQDQKDGEIEALWKYYKEKAPYTITSLPMNMEFLDSQAYSGAFRKKYPKVNGLFWGYHWLQGAVYDMLWKARTLEDQRKQYAIVGKQYHDVELYKTDRDFMPMFAEVSPDFSRRFPHLANAFDNLHMLHDMVNDILASDWLSESQKEEQIKRAIYFVVDNPHKGEKPGDFKEGDYLHDHRFMEGQPGMGMMKMATPQLMYMPGMGWMNMSDCGHCSMPIDFDPKSGAGATVSAEGWTMNVRCVLCARDMAAQVEGTAIIRATTEDPNRPLILISDEEGNLSSNMKDVVFLEVPASHAGCSAWSRAFTSKAAFDAYVSQQEDDEDLKNAKPLSLEEWSKLNEGEPDTYEKREGPVENPYKEGGKTDPPSDPQTNKDGLK